MPSSLCYKIQIVDANKITLHIKQNVGMCLFHDSFGHLTDYMENGRETMD